MPRSRMPDRSIGTRHARGHENVLAARSTHVRNAEAIPTVMWYPARMGNAGGSEVAKERRRHVRHTFVHWRSRRVIHNSSEAHTANKQ
jgi:hypothetical protein